MNSDGAIIGGGIAGLSAALFAQQKGVHLPIFEKERTDPSVDHLLWLAPNGLRLLESLGLLESVREHSVSQEVMAFSSSSLRTLMALDCRALAKTNRFPILAIRRRKLYEVMTDALAQRGGTVTYGCHLEAIEQRNDRVFVSLRQGRAPESFSYVLAADGMGSTIRSSVFPSSEVEYQGIRTWLGRSRTPIAHEFIGKTIEVWGQGTRFVVTGTDSETAFWSALERAEVYQSQSLPIPNDTLSRLRELFSAYHPSVREVLANGDPATLYRCNFGVVTGLPAYAKGRVCLLGDAAHGMPPNMGQGASLALEDACVLIDELTANRNVEHAFRCYERTRRPRVRQMVQMANSMNTLFQPKSRIAAFARNTIAAAVPQRMTQWRMARLYTVPFALPSQN